MFGALQTALLASLFLGLSCGLIGSYVVVRRMSLFGDTMSHAVFPGVVLGFFLQDEKNPYFILGCALLAGILGALMSGSLQRTTRLKQDASLGVVLVTFFAFGVGLHSLSPQTGVSSYLYGQIAAITDSDLLMMGGVSLLIVCAVALLRRPFYVASFDPGFARNLSYPVKVLDSIFAFLLAAAVVVSMQAVGVVLVSAMLITPAATAYLLTDRFSKMMMLSVGFSILAGMIGCLWSYQQLKTPTGPAIAISAAALFGLAFLFAPQYGVLAKYLRRRQQVRQIRRENTLQSLYRIKEQRSDGKRAVTLSELAQYRRRSPSHVLPELFSLKKVGLIESLSGRDVWQLTMNGEQRAAELIRNHRLWELYLINEADYQTDHVHDDAEKMEHVLKGDLLEALEKQLDFPTADPHGMPIPDPAKTSVLLREGGQK